MIGYLVYFGEYLIVCVKYGFVKLWKNVFVFIKCQVFFELFVLVVGLLVIVVVLEFVVVGLLFDWIVYLEIFVVVSGGVDLEIGEILLFCLGVWCWGDGN